MKQKNKKFFGNVLFWIGIGVLVYYSVYLPFINYSSQVVAVSASTRFWASLPSLIAIIAGRFIVK